MKIKVSDLTPRQLNYAVCAIEGKALERAKPATHDEVAARVASGPFTMYEIVWTMRRGDEKYTVGPITVTGVGRPEAPEARCIQFTSRGQRYLGSANQYFFTEEEARKEALIWGEGFHDDWRFDSNWNQAGPIIERECISIEYGRAEFKSEWIAYKLGLPHEDNPEGGPTPLIAAMRCYVASKLGDEVEIPEGV